MKIATVVLTHAHPDLTADTVDAIETWVGERVMVLVDEAGWSKFNDTPIGGARIERGFLHGLNRGTYRNSALGLKKLYESWSDSDWYLYTEYDCLFTSADFLTDLAQAEAHAAWCVGVDLRRYAFQTPLLESLLARGHIAHSYYLLGCCLFLSREFLAQMHGTGFLDRLIDSTKDFDKGFFPGYSRWAFEEELWPTVAVQLGGSLYELACWKGEDRQWQQRHTGDPRVGYAEGDNRSWRGRHPSYAIRFSPGIAVTEITRDTAIVHPSKNLNHPIRSYYREQREAIRKWQSTVGNQLYVPQPDFQSK